MQQLRDTEVGTVMLEASDSDKIVQATRLESANPLQEHLNVMGGTVQ